MAFNADLKSQRAHLARVASRAQVAPFLAMEVLREANALAAEGRTILHLEVGEPAMPLPDAVCAAVSTAIAGGAHLGYGEALGLPPLRAGIRDLYAQRYGIDVQTDRIAVTAGASGAFVLGLVAAFDPGARIGLGEPAYPPYRAMLQALDLTPVTIPCDQSTGYQPDAAMLTGLHLDGLILASPANPTGSMVSDVGLVELIAHCRDRAIRLVMDEIYHGLVFDRPEITAAALEPDALVINSFSKAFGLTGWRVGWLVAPQILMPAIEALSQSLYICPPMPSQYAALACLDHPEAFAGRREQLKRHRDILEAALRRAGLQDIAPADGAFYLYAATDIWGARSTEIARRLLHEAGIAATPGVDFDPQRGERYMRFSYAGPSEQIEAAAQAIERWAADL